MTGRRGAIIAAAAAALILAGHVTARADDAAKGDDTINCAGVNECKGKGICAGPESACAGMNACKGKGVVAMSAEECKKKGGKIVAKQM